MARDFKLPDLGEGLTEAEIVKVLVAEGDQVQEDQPVFLVETEKAQVELPSPYGGRVSKVHVRPGQRIKVGAVLLSLDAAGGTPAAPQVRAASPAPTKPAGAPPPPAGAPPAATPATRRLARELGVELGTVKGSGPGGRITDDDVRAATGHSHPRRRRPPSRPSPRGRSSRRERCRRSRASSSGDRSSASRSAASAGGAPSTSPSPGP